MSKNKQAKLSITDEFAGADLGDKRRTRRLEFIVERMMDAPAESFPARFKESSELEGTYRFMSNENITPEAIIAPHRSRTAERASHYNEVLVPHDTTQFNFGTSERDGLGVVGREGKSRGCLAHVSLVLAPTESREPLGVLSHQIINRLESKKAKRKKQNRKQRQQDPGNESRKWLAGVESVEDALRGKTQAIHIMDREGDNYALLAAMTEKEYRFVVRGAHDRLVAGEQGETVRQVLAKAPVRDTRTIEVGKRGGTPTPAYRLTHPRRDTRRADVSISAASVTIRRPDTASECPHKSIRVNFVRVFEANPPKGETAVEWYLCTTEPIDSAEQVWRIVDIYRARWVIEELFKALKTGCDYESRQFESLESLLRVLAIFLPIAWQLLRLRTLSHYDNEAPASKVLSQIQLTCLRTALWKRCKQVLPEAPTVRDALLAIAKLGGHLKRNGEPGWIVLMRGFKKLLNLVEGYILAREKM